MYNSHVWMLLQIVNDQFITILESINAILCISLRVRKLYHQSNQNKQIATNIKYHTGFDDGAWDPFDAFFTGVFKDESDGGCVEVIPSIYNPKKMALC